MNPILSKLAVDVFDVIRGTGRAVKLYDESGNKVIKPEEATHFYTLSDHLMIIISDDGADSSLSLYVGEQVSMDSISKLVNTLRSLANTYNVLFDLKVFEHDIVPKGFVHNLEVQESVETIEENDNIKELNELLDWINEKSDSAYDTSQFFNQPKKKKHLPGNQVFDLISDVASDNEKDKLNNKLQK